MPTGRGSLPIELKALAVALVVLAAIGIALAVGGLRNASLADLIRGGSLAVVALVCVVVVVVRGRRRPRR